MLYSLHQDPAMRETSFDSVCELKCVSRFFHVKKKQESAGINASIGSCVKTELGGLFVLLRYGIHPLEIMTH